MLVLVADGLLRSIPGRIECCLPSYPAVCPVYLGRTSQLHDLLRTELLEVAS
jgi:hypothetical protein